MIYTFIYIYIYYMFNYTYIYTLKIVISHGYVTNNQRLPMVPRTSRWRDDNLYEVALTWLGRSADGTILRRCPPPQFKNQHSAKWCYELLLFLLVFWFYHMIYTQVSWLRKAALGFCQLCQDTPESCCLRSRTTIQTWLPGKPPI